MERTDAVNPNKSAEQQGAARFKQVTPMHQQILMLAALALSSTLNALGLPLGVRNLIFLQGGGHWTGVVAHFFEVRRALLDGALTLHCRSCW